MTQVHESNVTGTTTLMSSIRRNILGELNNSDFLGKLLEDLTSSYKWLLFSALLALLLAFIWLISIQLLAWLVVWSTIVLALVLAAGCTGFFWFAYVNVGMSASTLSTLDSYHIHKSVLLGIGKSIVTDRPCIEIQLFLFLFLSLCARAMS
jgi:glucan phosphoethanolaminetransferase (alkaline phosphatase superfamily)